MTDSHRPPSNRPHQEADAAVEHEHGHEHGLTHTFREKAISLRSMDRGLMVLTLLAMAIVIAAGILIITKGLPWPQVRATSDVAAQTIPLPVMIGCSIFLVLAWSYILAGSLHSHLALRIVGMLAWTFGNAAALTTTTSVYGAIADGLLILLAWAMAITMWVVDRFYNDRHKSAWHHRLRLRLSTFLFFAVITGLLFLFGSLGGVHTGSFGFFLSFQLLAIQLLLIPMLYLAGTDFAEWSDVVAGRVGAAIQRVSGRFATSVLAALVVIAVALILAERINFMTLRGAAIVIGESMVPLAIMAAVGVIAIRRKATAQIPFYALVTAGLVGYGSLIGGSVLACQLGYCTSSHEAGSPYIAYPHREKPVFTLSYDKSWTPSAEHIPGGEDAVVFRGTDASQLPVRFVVLAVPDKAGAEDPLTTAVPALFGGPVMPSGDARQQDRWQVQDYSVTSRGNGYQGRAWTRVEGGERWLLTGVSPLAAGGAYDELFAHMVSTWEPKAAPEPAAGSKPAPAHDNGKPNQFAFDYTIAPFLWLGVFIVAGLLLRRGGRSASGGLFMIIAGVFFLGYGARYLFGVFFGGHDLAPPLPWWILAPDMENTIGAVAVWTLLALVFLLVTGRLTRDGAPLLRLLLVLLLALVGLRMLYQDVFGTALSAGYGRPAIQAIVLMAALLWDVAMSGENLTNREGDNVPRHSRVLMYFGYIMLVATAVLFFSAIQGPGAEGHEFESDMWPQLGIQLMGVPLVLTFFFANLGIWLRRRHGGGSEAPEHERPSPPPRIEGTRPTA